MSENKKPGWLNVHKLVQAADSSIQKKASLENSIKLNSTRITQIAAYSCPGCRLKFTTGQIEPQIRKAAREGKSYVECPQCSTALKEDRVVQIKGAPDIVRRAEYLRDANRHPDSGRVPNMWVDKAIYGRLVQKLSEFVAKIGITNPQMRFQRGIRSSKFPGEPHSAKGAEFSVEFVDKNNTRNRIFIQAGLTSKGEFIFPKIFKNTIGQEYPLTKEAIANLTNGKLFNPVMLNAEIPPLKYRDRDYTRFREISAEQDKMQKTAQDPTIPTSNDPVDENALDMQVQEIGITDPADQQAVKEIMKKYIDPNNPQAFAPGMSAAQTGENFMQGVGLANMKNKLNLRKISKIVTAIQEDYTDAVLGALNDGLSYDEAVIDVYNKTGMPLNDSVWAAAVNYLEDRINNEPAAVEAALAKQLVVLAEEKIAKKYQKTAEEIKNEFDFSGLTSSEVETFVDTFVKEYNNALTSGQGPTQAQRQAHYAASSQLHSNRVKRALRDEKTLVPFTEPDPEYSLAEQTVQSEPRFDKPDGDPLKYDEMDGGISDVEDRNITHMFGRDKQAKKAYIEHENGENGEYVVHAESGKQLGKHKTKEEAEKQLQAIEISKHKKGSVKVAAYELTDAGHDALNQLIRGITAPGYNTQVLRSILGLFSRNPGATTETLQNLAASVGIDPEIVRATFTKALEQGFLTIEPESPPEETGEPLSSEGSISKEAESTGVDLDADEVGPNPINYSRYKGMVQDLIRAENIPPTKVDMHALKDNKYSLKDLKELVQTFKVNDDAAMYPTAHASREDLIKLAESKLSEMMKEMPMERIPDEKDTSAEGETRGGNEPPLTKDEISEMRANMSEDTPGKDTIPGGYGDNVPSAAFDAEQLARGIEVEKEHTDDPEKAKEIAKDHLMEDPAYYIKLKQMESTSPRNVEELHAALTEQAFNIRKKTYAATDEEGNQIAQALHIEYKGIFNRDPYNLPMYTFNDPTTESTFMADTLEMAQDKLSILRSRFGITASKTAQEEPLPPGTILGPSGEVVSQPKESPLRIEPPQFLTRKEPKIPEEEAVEATPEETALIQELTAGKQQIDTIQNQIAGMQKELQIKIGPLQQELGAKGQAQMKATRALITLMKQLNHTLIQADDKIGHYIEAPLVHKLTAADKLKVLLTQFGDKATQALAEAEQNLNRIEQAVVVKYKQWPKKTSADIEAEDQFIATLYQNTYNTLADLLDTANELNQVLV